MLRSCLAGTVRERVKPEQKRGKPHLPSGLRPPLYHGQPLADVVVGHIATKSFGRTLKLACFPFCGTSTRLLEPPRVACQVPRGKFLEDITAPGQYVPGNCLTFAGSPIRMGFTAANPNPRESARLFRHLQNLYTMTNMIERAPVVFPSPAPILDQTWNH